MLSRQFGVEEGTLSKCCEDILRSKGHFKIELLSRHFDVEGLRRTNIKVDMVFPLN